jgi:predicted metal-dependent hydrolase
MISGVLRYGPDEVEYSVVENARLVSRVRIHVDPDGHIEVEGPVGVGPEQIRRAVQKRSRWIFRNVKAAGSATKYALPRQYISGEAHFYLGRRHKLIVVQANDGLSKVTLRRGRIEVCLRIADPAAVRRRLREWYRERATAYFSRKLTELAARFDGIAAAPNFQLLSMEKRWGSCSPTGQIILNPSLVKAPVHCVEYVLTHELCHLVEHNHSKRFYGLLDRHRPNWRAEKKELDELAEQLLVD